MLLRSKLTLSANPMVHFSLLLLSFDTIDHFPAFKHSLLSTTTAAKPSRFSSFPPGLSLDHCAYSFFFKWPVSGVLQCSSLKHPPFSSLFTLYFFLGSLTYVHGFACQLYGTNTFICLADISSESDISNTYLISTVEWLKGISNAIHSNLAHHLPHKHSPVLFTANDTNQLSGF